MTSRSLKAPAAAASLTGIRPRRPQMPSRTSSTSSISSLRFLDFSNPPTPNIPTSTATTPSAAGYFITSHDTGHCGSSASYSILDSPRVGRSIPIAIELPPRRKSGPADTPPAPLSARGDLLGGYFPLHEDIERSYSTHPFNDYRFPSGNQIPSGSASPSGSPAASVSDPDSPFLSPLMPHSPSGQHSAMADFAPALASTPIPTITMGKYHPSNYKNKRSTPPTSNSLQLPSPQSPDRPQHKRQKSDVRKKLQQYQRDMVEQAAVAAKLAMPGLKPGSPRLHPLGSPGDLVTPMLLEEAAGYMSARTTFADGAATGREKLSR